jgi:ubiquinone/menaquinone biosynthesis C-methylase UbiE
MDPIESSRPRNSSQIATYFDRFAGTYGDGAYYQGRRQAVLEALAPEIAQARDILDVGCGNGAYLTKFVEIPGNRTVAGIDLSFEMLLSARIRTAAKCRLARANVAHLPFKPESFDLVFASHVLQFIADDALDGVVAELARRVRPGGILLATGRRGESARQMMSAFIGPDRWAEFRRLIFRRTMRRETDDLKDRFQQAFVKAGLTVEERAAPFTVDWPGIEEWLRIRWTPLIPPDEREQADAMIAEIARAASSQTFTMSELLILGTRDS